MKGIQKPWIKLRENIDKEDYKLIHKLEKQCIDTDKVTLKLELDYKIGTDGENDKSSSIQNINEFMYLDGEELIGYIGICSFGSVGAPIEVNGMVHPEYRKQGVFQILWQMVEAEWKRRGLSSMLLLCDRKSVLGKEFIKKTGALYQHSEYEMYLKRDDLQLIEKQLDGITFRKATNKDAYEIARQNTIYFKNEFQHLENASKEDKQDAILEMILPEEEEKRGMLIYLAEKDKQIVGKVHLQLTSGVCAIYGLGVLPEYRQKGIGRSILMRAIEKLKQANASEIMLQVVAENANALNLYKSCGFIETSTMDYYEIRKNPISC